MDQAWRKKSDSYRSGLKYMSDRATGKAKSILTPWDKFNDAMLDGMEWRSTVVIAARPGTGKTVIKDQIINNAHKLNPDQEFRILDISLEMVARVSAVREFSSVTGLTYKELCSAGGHRLTKKVVQQCVSYAKSKESLPIDIIENSMTVSELRDQLALYMDIHKGTPTIVALDHTLLVKAKDKQKMISELGEFFTESKKLYPVTFVVLSQLNRNIDNPDRSVNGKYGNYVLESDIFGSDALLQHADTVVGVNRPAKSKIRFYGPDRYVISDDKTLVWHFLKARNGDLRMSFFKAIFEEMRVEEMATPPQDLRTI